MSRDSIPVTMRRLVRSGGAGRQRVTLRGDPVLIVGVPIPAVGAEYFQVFSLSEFEDTVGVIRRSLLGAGAATTLLAALLGFWASRRVLRPLTDVSAAAERIAEGDVERRLQATDDPDLARLADSFNRMVDALAERMRRDARFASNVSHELRSPLTTVVTGSELLANQRDQLPERLRPAIDLLAADVARFQRLVEELLELNSTEAADEVVLEPVSLGDLVCRHTRSPDGSALTIDMPPNVADLIVVTDARRFDRVLGNLLDNAETHGGGVTAVSVDVAGDEVRVRVDDAGPGVREEHRERIFERFYRGPLAGRRETGTGTGLGLALVAEHVRVLGGEVHVEDAPGGGARFVVVLRKGTP
jgi:signal transduction histidine kinase